MKTESAIDQVKEPAPKTLKKLCTSKQKLWVPREKRMIGVVTLEDIAREQKTDK
jgi:hypothetical protein